MAIQWKYTDNQLLIVTKNSYRKALKLSYHHNASLNLLKSAYPVLVALYERYHPLHLKFVNEFVEWSSNKDFKKSKTKNIRDLLGTTYEKIYYWDLAIQGIFPAKSNEYKGIFARGKSIFLEGSIQERIGAYNTLAKNLSIYSSLNAVRDEVLVAYEVLNTARQTQLGSKGQVKSKIDDVKIAYINAMNMQYRNIGICMDAFWNQPAIIRSLFDVDTLHGHKQMEFTKSLGPQKADHIFMRTLLADDQLLLKNNGNAEIWFYYSNKKKGKNSTPVVIPPLIEQIVEISAFNVPEYGTYRNLTAINNSNSVSTSLVVKIL